MWHDYGSLLSAAGRRICRAGPQMAGVAAATLLALLCLAGPLGASAAVAAAEDAAILQRLRAAVWASTPEWVANLPGWVPDSTIDVCSWGGVACNANGRVRVIKLVQPPLTGRGTTAAGGALGHSPLLPELAQLRSLESCLLVCTDTLPWPPIPAAWLAPGAFPRLQQLSLGGHSLGAPLPDIPPGALPSLEHLSLRFPALHTRLPPGWGADPTVLPRLRELVLLAQVQGGLPAAWSHGFRELEQLSISTRSPLLGPAVVAWRPAGAPRTADAAGTGGGHGLPAAWASGFPKLRALTLNHLGLIGTLPSSWQDDGFSQLLTLGVPYNELSGTLPPQLLDAHPTITALNFSGNRFSGPLPGAWAFSVLETLFLGSNALSGPAFPPAWLQPNALPRLREVDLSSNPQLSGELPASLSWAQLQSLKLGGTSVRGSVAEAWCHAPFAPDLRVLILRSYEDEPPLPPCAANSFLNLLQAQLVSSPTGGRHAGGRAARANLALLLPLATLVAAGAAGRVLLRRRQRRQRDQCWEEQHCGQPLQARQARDSPSSSEAASSAGTAGSVHGLPTNRQARVEALLGQALASRRGGGIHLRLLQYAPKHALAHAPQERHAPTRAGAEAWSREMGSPVHCQWGLDTAFLRLLPGELAFVVDGQGMVVLGRGSSCVIYRAVLNGQDVAAKVFELETCMASSITQAAVWNEAALMRQCTHERIVPLYGVAVVDSVVVLAAKLMPGGSLKAALLAPKAPKLLRWAARGRQVAVDVAEGLAFLHQENVLHGDLKSSNVLLAEDGRACIGDLGLSQVLDSQARTAAGCTFTHAAPEQLLGQRCTLAADIYSFGVVLMEVASCRVLVQRGEDLLHSAALGCPQSVLLLIERCISSDPAQRPAAGEVLRCLLADSGA